MENIDTVKQFISSLDQSLDELEPMLDTLLSKTLDERLIGLTSIDKLKMTNSYTYILSSLLFAYLKSKGVDTAKHEIMAELNRCKSYMNRLKELENVDTKLIQKEKQENEMINRFMKSQLQGNSTVVTGVQEPAISRVSFQGKHTKFVSESDNESKTSTDTNTTNTATTDKKQKPVKQTKLNKPNKSGKVIKPSKSGTIKLSKHKHKGKGYE